MIAQHRPGIAPASGARIGPNAITRVAEALGGAAPAHAAAVFATAGLAHYLRAPPEAMVDEREVVRLHRALRGVLGERAARRVARRAGALTGDYLLAHRIPAVARGVLRALPAALAAPLLLAAIGRHAWTFAGSGRFTATAGRPATLAIAGNPLCRGAAADEPLCDYYAATFERLFRALVRSDARVVETACEACGADACRFEVRW
jgi:divinyl protochlorophyllide a 8-vinyl-reductase